MRLVVIVLYRDNLSRPSIRQDIFLFYGAWKVISEYPCSYSSGTLIFLLLSDVSLHAPSTNSYIQQERLKRANEREENIKKRPFVFSESSKNFNVKILIPLSTEQRSFAYL